MKRKENEKKGAYTHTANAHLRSQFVAVEQRRLPEFSDVGQHGNGRADGRAELAVLRERGECLWDVLEGAVAMR